MQKVNAQVASKLINVKQNEYSWLNNMNQLPLPKQKLTTHI